MHPLFMHFAPFVLFDFWSKELWATQGPKERVGSFPKNQFWIFFRSWEFGSNLVWPKKIHFHYIKNKIKRKDKMTSSKTQRKYWKLNLEPKYTVVRLSAPRTSPVRSFVSSPVHVTLPSPSGAWVPPHLFFFLPLQRNVRVHPTLFRFEFLKSLSLANPRPSSMSYK